MIPERDGARTEIRATAQVTTTCRHHTAVARANAAAVNAAALAEGVWPPTPQILDAQARLSAAVVFDLVAL